MREKNETKTKEYSNKSQWLKDYKRMKTNMLTITSVTNDQYPDY